MDETTYLAIQYFVSGVVTGFIFTIIGLLMLVSAHEKKKNDPDE